jgi:hypothetical protein
MKIDIETVDKGILIIPETDFELQFLKKIFTGHTGETYQAFLKTGQTPSDVVGLKITSSKEIMI